MTEFITKALDAFLDEQVDTTYDGFPITRRDQIGGDPFEMGIAYAAFEAGWEASRIALESLQSEQATDVPHHPV